MINRRRLIAAAAVTPLVLRRTAAGQEPLLVLGWEGYVDPPTIERFRDRTGLEIVLETIGAYDEIFERLRAGGVHQYSVVAPHHGLTAALHAAGLIQPLDLNQIPRLAEIDPHFSLPETTEIDGTRYAAPLLFGTCPAIYNADLLPEPPANWADLDSDAYTGKVAMLDDSFSHFNLWGRAVGAAKAPVLSADEMDATATILTNLKQDRVSHFTPFPHDLVAQLANGKAVISTTGWEGLTLLPERGAANLKIARMAPGDFSFVQTLAIPSAAPMRDAAHQFIDFMLSPEEQAALANRTTRGIVHPAAVGLIAEPVRSLTDYANLDAAFAQSPILPFPPLAESPDGTASYLDWVLSWERIRTVKSNAAP
jgi:spermidine/putrescine transport system substrate-binding protein